MTHVTIPRNTADGVDDGPHADAPFPGRRPQDRVDDIAADPRVDNVWGRLEIRKEHALVTYQEISLPRKSKVRC